MHNFDFYLVLNIFVSILFIISIIRYYNKKNEYKFDKNVYTLNQLKTSGVLLIVSSILLLLMLSSVFTIFKWYIFLILLIILYIILLKNFVISFNKLNREEENDNKHFIIFSSILCFLLITSTIFFIWMRFGAKSGIDKIFNNAYEVIYDLSNLIKNPNDNSRNKAINGLGELVDIYNDIANEDYNVDKEKIKNVASNLFDSILSTNSEMDYKNIDIGIEKILEPFTSSNSDIDKNKIIDALNSLIK